MMRLGSKLNVTVIACDSASSRLSSPVLTLTAVTVPSNLPSWSPPLPVNGFEYGPTNGQMTLLPSAHCGWMRWSTAYVLPLVAGTVPLKGSSECPLFVVLKKLAPTKSSDEPIVTCWDDMARSTGASPASEPWSAVHAARPETIERAIDRCRRVRMSSNQYKTRSR